MADAMNWSWAGLLALGAFHGVNPGMGWLFAVALGMQERRRAAVYRAMLPLALGHGLAIAAAVLVAAMAGAVVPLKAIQWVVAGYSCCWEFLASSGTATRVGWECKSG